jgi:hypothetical protein
MSVAKFLVNLIGLVLFLLLLIGVLVLRWLKVIKPKRPSLRKPRYPVKTFPKYAKNKRCLTKPNKKNKSIWIKGE